MPELPEIETIKRVIEPQIQGLMIDKVNVKRPEKVHEIHLQLSIRQQLYYTAITFQKE